MIYSYTYHASPIRANHFLGTAYIRKTTMSSELLEWAYTYLERDENIIVPIKKMWSEWRSTHTEPTLEYFTELLLADKRFEEVKGADHTEGLEWDSQEELDEYVQEMEAMDFFSGPCLKLKDREISLEYIAVMIKKHNDRMEVALRQAHQAMPDGINEPAKSQLNEIMAQAEELRRHWGNIGRELEDTSGP
jgi:hypothetical protein